MSTNEKAAEVPAGIHFDFTVTGITREQADALLDLIVREVEKVSAEAVVGGGLVVEGAP